MSNLSNTLSQISIDGSKVDNVLSVQSVSQNFYDRLMTKDPMTIYVIIETGEMYRGENRMGSFFPSLKERSRFLSIKKTPAGPEYEIYETDGEIKCLICSYKNPQDALDFLERSLPNDDRLELVNDVFKKLKSFQGISLYTEKIKRYCEDIMALIVLYLGRGYLINELTSLVIDNLVPMPPISCIHTKWESYNIYTFIWSYLLDHFNVKNMQLIEDDSWLRKTAEDLVEQVLKRFR